MKIKILIISLSSLLIYSALFCVVLYYFERKITLLHRIDEMTFSRMTADYIENKLSDLNQITIGDSDNRFALKNTYSLINRKLIKLSNIRSKDLFNSIKLISNEHKDLFLETNKAIENLDKKYDNLNQFIEFESSEFLQEKNFNIKYINLKSVIDNDSILFLKKKQNIVEGTVIYQEQPIFRNLSNYNDQFFIINSNNDIIYENKFSKSKNIVREKAQDITLEIKNLGFIYTQREVDGILFQICPISKFGFYYVEAKALANLDVEMDRFKMLFAFLFFISFIFSEVILLIVLMKKQPSA